MTPEPPARPGRVHHVGVTVSDLDRSLAFYTHLLDGHRHGPWERSGPSVDAVTGYPGVLVRQAFVEAPGGSTLVELLQYVGGSDTTIDPDNGHVGAVHVAVTVTDLDRTLARLAAEGVTAVSDPIRTSAGPMEGCRVVYVLDPDRVRVELVELP